MDYVYGVLTGFCSTSLAVSSVGCHVVAILVARLVTIINEAFWYQIAKAKLKRVRNNSFNTRKLAQIMFSCNVHNKRGVSLSI